jgi:hypothetical protein
MGRGGERHGALVGFSAQCACGEWAGARVRALLALAIRFPGPVPCALGTERSQRLGNRLLAPNPNLERRRACLVAKNFGFGYCNIFRFI